MSSIHPTAVIHPTARLGSSVNIGPYTIIGEEAMIGDRTTIGAHAVVEFAVLGKNNCLHAGCYVGTPPQDFKYAGERTRLVMGDNNVVRECVTLNRGTADTGETAIGSGCLFMAYSHIAHDCRIGNGVILVNSVGVAGHVEIGDHTVVGGLAGIHQFVRIGRYCMIGGGSMVGKDVPSFCTAQGDRATLRGLNVVGIRRSGLDRDAFRAIKNAYQTLFMSGTALETALLQLKSTDQPPQVLEMLAFIEQSKRGIMRPIAQEIEEKITV